MANKSEQLGYDFNDILNEEVSEFAADEWTDRWVVGEGNVAASQSSSSGCEGLVSPRKSRSD